MVLVQPTMPGREILGPGTYGPGIGRRFEGFLEPLLPSSASYPSLWKGINLQYQISFEDLGAIYPEDQFQFVYLK